MVLPFDICHLRFDILQLSLLVGWLSILVTNFFGFSVVVTALFFWLIPAFSFTFSGSLNPKNSLTIKLFPIKPLLNVATASILLVICYLLFAICKLWYADTLFAKGNAFFQAGEDLNAYPLLQKAVSLAPHEPLYHDRFSQVLANLATIAFLEKKATLSATLLNTALTHSQKQSPPLLKM